MFLNLLLGEGGNSVNFSPKRLDAWIESLKAARIDAFEISVGRGEISINFAPQNLDARIDVSNFLWEGGNAASFSRASLDVVCVCVRGRCVPLAFANFGFQNLLDFITNMDASRHVPNFLVQPKEHVACPFSMKDVGSCTDHCSSFSRCKQGRCRPFVSKSLGRDLCFYNVQEEKTVCFSFKLAQVQFSMFSFFLQSHWIKAGKRCAFGAIPLGFGLR